MRGLGKGIRTLATGPLSLMLSALVPMYMMLHLPRTASYHHADQDLAKRDARVLV